MMRIELRSSNVPISDALREHVGRRLDFALRRFAGRIGGVTVRLVDINGPKGGPDKRCRMVVRLTPARTLIVEATDSDLYAAVSHAAMRLDECVSRALTRRRSVGHIPVRDVAAAQASAGTRAPEADDAS